MVVLVHGVLTMRMGMEREDRCEFTGGSVASERVHGTINSLDLE